MKNQATSSEERVARQPKLAEIAERIYAHLKRIEADPKLNLKQHGGTSAYWCVNTWRGGSRVFVKYVAYQSKSSLTREEALAYLAWLDAGNVGKHWEIKKAVTA